MHDNSYLFIQTSQAEMVQNNQFDTIYHEHISFFNINSAVSLRLKEILSNGAFSNDSQAITYSAALRDKSKPSYNDIRKSFLQMLNSSIIYSPPMIAAQTVDMRVYPCPYVDYNPMY